MKTETLIDQLAQSVKPVKPLPTKWVRFSQFAAMSILGASVIFFGFSKRHDLRDVFLSLSFLMGLFTLSLGFLSAIFSATLLQLPTFKNKKYASYSVMSVAVLSFFYIIRIALYSDHAESISGFSPSTGVECTLAVTMLATLPIIFLLFGMRRGAVTKPNLAGLSIGLVGSTLGAFFLQFSCSNNIPSHLLLWHILLPCSALLAVSVFAAQRLLKW